jgi:hypothetical protein
MISITIEGKTIEECAKNLRRVLKNLEERLGTDPIDFETRKAQRDELRLLATWFEEQTALNFERFLLEHFDEARLEDIPQYMWPAVHRKMLMAMGLPI